MRKKIGIIAIFLGLVVWFVGAIVCLAHGESISLQSGMFSSVAKPGALHLICGIAVFAYCKIFKLNE